jgi:Na+/H+ antiporter NhaD/arsenite permease-like protein
MEEIFAVALFVVVLAGIAFELVNRTVAALLGAAVIVSFGIVEQGKAASEFVDWNVIGLLAGMMIIVAVLNKTGIFEYLAIKSAQWGKARPGRILILLSLVTAILSAFLDNVTTVILMVPVTFVIADALGVSALPFLLAQVMASNIGGAATLIGDPPNILVGSAAGLSFVDFVLHLAPLVLLVLPFVLGFFYVVFRKEVRTDNNGAGEAIRRMNARAAIRNRVLLRKSSIVLGVVILGFLLHSALHLEAATIALFGAAALMLLARTEVEEVLREVEWPTLLFFVGLFVLVGGLEVTGFIGRIAELLTGVTESQTLTAMLVLWGSAIASGIVDNIPFTATMIPVIQELARTEGLSDAEVRPLWWALTIGADFGGNLTLIGASANVVVAGMSERAGRKISFLKFMAYGIPVTLISLAVATPYVLLRYYL